MLVKKAELPPSSHSFYLLCSERKDDSVIEAIDKQLACCCCNHVSKPQTLGGYGSSVHGISLLSQEICAWLARWHSDFLSRPTPLILLDFLRILSSLRSLILDHKLSVSSLGLKIGNYIGYTRKKDSSQLNSSL